MKSLTSSSCFTSPLPSHNSSLQFHPTTHQLVSFPLTKLASLHLISVQPNHLHPINSSSSPSPLSPESQNELELAETVNQEYCESKTAHVKFQLKKECSFGEQFAILGDDPNFGLWDPENAIPLNWSDDHVWNLELDVPIGKSIHFKFILKGITGSILWQPGPDRILKTWDTTNTIVVCEDWEDAMSQKLLEEEKPISIENADPAVNSEMKLVADNFMHQNASNVKNEKLIEEVESNPEKEPLPSTDVKPVIADTAASSEETTISIIADNISNSNKEPAVNENHQVLKEEHEGESNKEATTFEKILQNNRKTPEAENSESTNIEGSLKIEEGDPVLVPGLPLLPVDYSKTEADDEAEGEKSSTSAFDASVGVNEVENHILPEKPNIIQLKEKHDVDQHESEMIEAFNDMEQKLEANEENQQISNQVIEKDIQWGRRTIQRLLTNLGLL